MSDSENNHVIVSEMTEKLREALDEAGFEWFDDSEDWSLDDHYVTHLERTKVVIENNEEDRFILGSFIYGYSVSNGKTHARSYGWPDFMEGMVYDGADCEPITIDDAISQLEHAREKKAGL